MPKQTSALFIDAQYLCEMYVCNDPNDHGAILKQCVSFMLEVQMKSFFCFLSSGN